MLLTLPKGAPVSVQFLLTSVAAAGLLHPVQAMAQAVTGFPSAYAIVGTTTGGVTTFGQVAQYAVGNDSYFVSANGVNRYGDYSATVVDPSNSSNFWTIQEVAQAAGNWQTQIAEVSVGAGNAVHLVTSFAGSSLSSGAGLSSNGYGFAPPDSMLAAGPSQVVAMANGEFDVYSKTGSLQSQKSLDAFWTAAGVSLSSDVSDPRLLYDAVDSRWIAAAIDTTAQNHLLIAVSKTSDPTAGWTGFSILANPTTKYFADFPTLGMNGSGVFLATNNFSGSTGEGSTIVVIDKAKLLAGTLSFSEVENQAYTVSGVIPQPVVDQTNSALPEAMLGDYNTGAGYVRASAITGTLAAPTVTGGPFVQVQPYSAPPAASQPNNVTALNAGDTRFSSSVVLTASGDLWAVQTVQNPTNASNDAIRYLDINAATNTVKQQGLIGDPGFSFFYPSIAVNPAGQVVIGFSGTAAVTTDTLNAFVTAPTTKATAFSIVLQGDQRSNVSLLATENDPLVNPFAYVNQKIVGSGNAYVTVSLNSAGNTVITYTGDNPILPTYQFFFGSWASPPHFGVDGSQGAQIIGQYWTTGDGSSQNAPVLQVAGPALTPPGGGAGDGGDGGEGDDVKLDGPPTPYGLVSYVIFFAEITVGGMTTGLWDEIPFDTGTQPTLLLTNPTDLAEILSNVGFLFSNTHIPLDDLNFGAEPPPGTPGSLFTPLLALDGATLCPGCTVDVTLAVPEAPVWLLISAGFAGLAAFRPIRGRRSDQAMSGRGRAPA